MGGGGKDGRKGLGEGADGAAGWRWGGVSGGGVEEERGGGAPASVVADRAARPGAAPGPQPPHHLLQRPRGQQHRQIQGQRSLPRDLVHLFAFFDSHVSAFDRTHAVGSMDYFDVLLVFFSRQKSWAWTMN